MSYIIRVCQDGCFQYLFNIRMLVQDARLAKTFSSIPLAKRYLRKSEFSHLDFVIVTLQYDTPTQSNVM